MVEDSVRRPGLRSAKLDLAMTIRPEMIQGEGEIKGPQIHIFAGWVNNNREPRVSVVRGHQSGADTRYRTWPLRNNSVDRRP